MTRHKRGSRFLRIDERVYRSLAFRTLPAAAMKLWILLRMDFTPARNGRAMATLATLRSKGWHSNDLLRRMLPVLIERGLLAYTSKAPPNTYRRASLLRFTDEPVFPDHAEGTAAIRPTDDFLQWVPKAGDATTDEAPPKRQFTKSAVRTKVSPRSGSELVRGPDYEGQKTVRGPDYGRTKVSTAPDSEIEQIDAERARSPRSGHTLASARGTGQEAEPLPAGAPTLFVSDNQGIPMAMPPILHVVPGHYTRTGDERIDAKARYLKSAARRQRGALRKT